ncbi:hypothetical protein X798_01855 [Onchocerca flexuosa]|uniref:Uncharacterized protein n=1 Tax=Onchocerca flexuosa TaxID=387005 RepID=A0A238C0P4_9BILA|nr:hypothetical protein X798_01855 [Onchocerca flexuosa]
MKGRQELHRDIQNAIMGLILVCKSHSVSPTLCNTTEAGVLVHVVNLSTLTPFHPHALSHSLMTSVCVLSRYFRNSCKLHLC